MCRAIKTVFSLTGLEAIPCFFFLFSLCVFVCVCVWGGVRGGVLMIEDISF